MKKLDVLVDAIIFQKPVPGGIARIFQEILPRMCALEPELRITLFSDGPILQPLPQHPQISLKSAPQLKRNLKVSGWRKTALFPFRRIASQMWNRARGHWIGNGNGIIWHSTYYTFPERWNGYQVVTIHDLILERFPELFCDRLDDVARLQKKRCILHADSVICISETTKNELKGYMGQAIPGKIYVISPACSEAFHAIHGNSEQIIGVSDRPFLLYIGKREGYKNFSTLLEAYGKWERRFEIDLIVVGSNWTPSEGSLIEKLGIIDHVKLLQKVEDPILCQLYNKALAFVYPSLYEGFGIPLLEAMACGCPIIASRIPSTIEVAGEFPTYFEPQQIGSLNDAMTDEMERGREPNRLSYGFDRVHIYSWDRAAQQTLEVYRDLI